MTVTQEDMITQDAPVTLEKRLTLTVRDFLVTPRKMLIDGKWIDSASGKTFPVYDPATGNVITQVAEGDTEDIERAVVSARRAFESGPWSGMTPAERGRIIWKIGDLILENADELAELESLDNGKPKKNRAGRGHPAGRRPLPLYGGLGNQALGQHNSIQSGIPYLYAARTRRRGGSNHSVELSSAHGRVEARARTDNGQLRHSQAR